MCLCIAGLKIDWSQCGQYLAVGGFTRLVHVFVCCRPEDRLVAMRSVPGSGRVYQTGYMCLCIAGLKIDWSQCGQYLAVGGFTRLPNLLCQNEVHFYTPAGELTHWVSVPSQVRIHRASSKVLVPFDSFLYSKLYLANICLL